MTSCSSPTPEGHVFISTAYYPEREGNKLAITVKKKKIFKAQSSNFLGEMAGFTFNLSREIQLSVITVFHQEKKKKKPPSRCIYSTVGQLPPTQALTSCTNSCCTTCCKGADSTSIKGKLPVLRGGSRQGVCVCVCVCQCGGGVIRIKRFFFFFLMRSYLSFSTKADSHVHSPVCGWSKCQVRGEDVGWYFMVSGWFRVERRCTYKLPSLEIMEQFCLFFLFF